MVELHSKVEALEKFDRALGGLDQAQTTRDALMRLRSYTDADIRSLTVTWEAQHDFMRITLANFRQHLARIIRREKRDTKNLSKNKTSKHAADHSTVIGMGTVVKEKKEQ